MKSCKKVPLVCPACQYSFGSEDEIKEHLRTSCKYVKITCSECKEEFQRYKFFYSGHTCPKPYETYRYVVESQDKEITKLKAGNESLKTKISDLSASKSGTEASLKSNIGQQKFVYNMVQ